MHEPGPPRTTTCRRIRRAGPAGPDPDGTYEWTLRDAPAESDARVDGQPVSGSSDDGELLVPGETSRPDAPVVHLRPDAPERTS